VSARAERDRAPLIGQLARSERTCGSDGANTAELAARAPLNPSNTKAVAGRPYETNARRLIVDRHPAIARRRIR